VPEAYLAKHLQALSRAGVVESVPGPRGGYRLARPADEISVLDVVEAIDGGEAAFRCTEIRRRGPAAMPDSAYRRPCGIDAVMLRADRAWRTELAAHSVGDVVRSLAAAVSPAAAEKAASWLGGVLAR
jgi:Rrf2 family protein